MPYARHVRRLLAHFSALAHISVWSGLLAFAVDTAALELKLSYNLALVPALSVNTPVAKVELPSEAAKPVSSPGLLSPATTPTPATEKATGRALLGSPDGQAPLGLGDQISITVFGQPDLSAEVTVGESGTIMVPLVGTLNVVSLSPAQLETAIADRLKSGGYLQNPGVSVQIRQLRSQLVSVLGEVQRPGRYPIQGRMTVLEALATAGGLTQRADRSVVLLRKPVAGASSASQVQEIGIQLDDASARMRGQMDVAVANDDVIYVGVQKQFYIHGEVRRPGAYPVEVGMNVMKALAISGGVSERGSIKRIKVHRLNERKELTEIKVDPYFTLQPDDVIFVDERLF